MRRCLFFLTILAVFSACSATRQGGGEIHQEQENIVESISRRPKIVIDAGHGGKDVGAESKTTPASQEKQFNLTTALMLNNFLKKMGYPTLLTRGEDFFVPLDLRAAFANSNDASVFVSVHYNSAPNIKAEGVEIYYFQSDRDEERSKQSKILAETVLDRIVKATESKSRGVKHGNLAVIRETNMPAILVEGGFVTNQNDLSKISSPDYLKTLAGSIALGIHDYLKVASEKR